jgi:hypothetical protein
MQHQHAQVVHLLGQAPGFCGRRHYGEACHALQHGALGVGQLQAAARLLAPVVPQQLRAHMVQPLQAAQVPSQRRHRLLAQLCRQRVPLLTVAQLGRTPAAQQLRARPFGCSAKTMRGERSVMDGAAQATMVGKKQKQRMVAAWAPDTCAKHKHSREHCACNYYQNSLRRNTIKRY